MGIFSFIGDIFGEVISWFIDVPEPVKEKRRGIEVTREGTNHPVPVVYGKREVNPIIVHKETTGNNNQRLWFVGVLCEGPVSAEINASDIRIDDNQLTDSRFSGKYGLYVDNNFKEGTNGSSTLIRFYYYTGQESNIYNGELAGQSGSNWSSTDTMDKFCYFVVLFEYNADLFRGEPNIKVVVRGKLCRDPKTSALSASENPALQLYDYLTDSVYGKGLSESDLDTESFNVAIAKCNNLVTNYSGGSSVNIFKSNVILNTDVHIFENVKILMKNMRGLYSFSDGKYSVKVEDDEEPALKLTRNQLVGNRLTYRGEKKEQRYNRVVAEFVNPAQRWEKDEVVWPDKDSNEEIQLLNEDNGEVLEHRLTLDGCTSKYQARELARVACLTSRKNMTVQATFTAEALQVVAGDIVALNMKAGTMFGDGYPNYLMDSTFSVQLYSQDSPGEWTEYDFVPYRVVKCTLLPSGEVQLWMREHQPEIYPWISGSELPDFDDPNLPDPYAGVDDLTGLSAVEELDLANNGDVVSFIDVSWDDPDNAFVDKYIIRWRKNGSSDPYKYVESVTTSAQLWGVRVGTTYSVEVIGMIESLNIRGSWASAASDTVLIDGDNGAPEAPSAISTSSGVYTVTINWTNPSDADLDVVEIHIRDTNITPSDDAYLEDIVKAKPDKTQSYTITMKDRVIGDTYYIFLKAIDKSENESSFSSSVTGVFNLATIDDLDADEELFSIAAMEKKAVKVLGVYATANETYDGMAAGNSGQNLYIISTATGGFTERSIFRYTMSTPYDVSTASLSEATLITTSHDCQGLAFSADGTRVYIVDSGSQEINEYLISAWDTTDLASATPNYTLDISANVTTPAGLCISSDGNYLYVSDTDDNNVHRYDLSTSYNLSTASHGANVLNASSQVTASSISEMGINNDGSRLFILDASDATIYGYDMSTEYDLGTAAYNQIAGTFYENLQSRDVAHALIAFSANGKNLYTYSSYTFNGGIGELGPNEKLAQFPSTLVRTR